MSTTDNNKRIAKNTLVLYVRMVLMTFIGLYTSRINLQALGVTDYGIMNVVGGLTSMSTLVTAACVLPLLLRPFVRETLVDFIWYILLCVACACLAVLFIGCSPHERDMIRTYAAKMKGKLLHRGAC